MNHIGDIFNQDKSGDVAEVSCGPGGKEHQIILTQWTNLDEIGVFVIGNVGLVIGSNELCLDCLIYTISSVSELVTAISTCTISLAVVNLPWSEQHFLGRP
jgi:hypothetical protein